MAKVIEARIFVGRRGYSERLDLKEERRLFKEMKKYDDDSRLDGMSFDDYYAPIPRSRLKKFSDINTGKHFLYGWIESLAQSDYSPYFLSDEGDEEVEVVWYDE